MKQSFYMYLSSADSILAHVNNSWREFVCEFNPELILESACPYGLRSASWSVSLLDLSISNLDTADGLPESVVLLCDIAGPSYINGVKSPVLRSLPGAIEASVTLAQPYYIGVEQDHFNSLTIRCLTRDLDKLKHADWPADLGTVLQCTLHFLRN